VTKHLPFIGPLNSWTIEQKLTPASPRRTRSQPTVCRVCRCTVDRSKYDSFCNSIYAYQNRPLNILPYQHDQDLHIIPGISFDYCTWVVCNGMLKINAGHRARIRYFRCLCKQMAEHIGDRSLRQVPG
jgi:hypothetical protein